MNSEIVKGALLGATAGLLITVLMGKTGKKKNSTELEKQMSDDVQESKQIKLMDRWSVKLALLGIGLGILTTLGMGYTNIGFMIGFGIPMALILGSVGLVIDFFRFRKK